MDELETFVQRTSRVRAELARLRAAIAAHEQEEADGTINESQQNQELVNNILEPLAEHLSGALDAAEQPFVQRRRAPMEFRKHSWMMNFKIDSLTPDKWILKCLRISSKRRVSLIAMAYIAFPLFLGCLFAIWLGPGAILMTAFWTQVIAIIFDYLRLNPRNEECIPLLITTPWWLFHQLFNRHERLNLTPPGPEIAPLEEDEVQGRALLQSIYAYIDAHGSKGYNLEEAKVLLECFVPWREIVWAMEERKLREAWLFDAARLASHNVDCNPRQFSANCFLFAGGMMAAPFLYLGPLSEDGSDAGYHCWAHELPMIYSYLLIHAVYKYYPRAFDSGSGGPLFILSYHFPWLGIVGWAVLVGEAHIIAALWLSHMAEWKGVHEEL